MAGASGRRLQAANTLIVLGYQLAKVQGLPEDSALNELVKDSKMVEKVAEGLAAQSLIAEDFLSKVSVILVQGASAEQVVKDINSGAAGPLTQIGEHSICST